MSTGLQLRQADEMNLSELQTLGQVFTKSGFFADTKDAAQAVVKVMAGMELGFPPIASMTGVYIVKGKVSLSANLIAAAVKRSGKYNYKVQRLDAEVCVIEFFENGESIGASNFTMIEAKAARLHQDWDKDKKEWKDKPTWKNFPRNMLFARAMSNGAKWFCPDIFGGPIYTPDELGAEVDGETGEVIEMPVEAVEVTPEPTPTVEPPPWAGTACHEDDEPAPQPVRTAKPESAQPKTDNITEWPRTRGLVGMIFAKCQSLNWTAANLADEIEKRFKMVIPEESVINGLADALTPQELKTLDQALAGEFENRKRTRAAGRES